MKTGRFNIQSVFKFLPEESVIFYCTFPEMFTGTRCWQHVAIFLCLCLKTKAWKLEKGFLKNFAIFTGKHLCWSLILIKLQALMPSNFSKKRLQHRCFPMNFAIFLRKAFFREQLRWIFLNVAVNLSLILRFMQISYKLLEHQELRNW